MTSGTTRENILRVSHRTRYAYAEPVTRSFHRGFLTPRTTEFQDVHESRVTINPPAAGSTTHEDYYGNRVALFMIDAPHNWLSVEARSELTIRPEPPAFSETRHCGWNLESVRQRALWPESSEDLRAHEFCFDSPHVFRRQEFAEYAASCFAEQTDFLTGVKDLMHRIHSEFLYDPAVTTISTPVSEVFVHKSGVCQDFAHLMIACLRSAGVAARYVSGYLVPGPNVIGAQASHAWISAYCPGTGWVDFDPTNDVLPAGRHITVAWGRDFSDVSPFRGVIVGGGEHEVAVEVSVSLE